MISELPAQIDAPAPRLSAPDGRLFALLLAFTGALSLGQLGRLPLLDVDEPVYGEVAREMARGGFGAWLTPHFNGSVWFDKPPLFYWLSALSVKVCGDTEWAARLPSALLAVGLVALTVTWARRLYPQSGRASLWAGFVLATGAQFFLMARAAVTDMTLCFCLLAALLCVYEWASAGRARAVLWAGAWTGLAMLAKGPVALALIGAQVALFLCVTGRARRLLAPALWGGLCVCAAVALPWYGAMVALHRQEFVAGFLEANNVTRFLKPEHEAASGVLLYIPMLLGGFLPWSLAVPFALWSAGRQALRARREAKPTLFLLLWCAVVFVFFSLSQTKLYTYIFPLFPALAVITGRWIAGRASIVCQRDAFLYAYAVLLAGMIAALWRLGTHLTVGHQTIPIAAQTLWAWTIALGAGTIVCVFAGPRRALGWMAPGIALGLCLLCAWLSPTWRTAEAYVSERGAARAAAAVTPPGGEFVALGLKHPSLVYYSQRRVRYSDDWDGEAMNMALHPGEAVALMPRKLEAWREFAPFAPVPRAVPGRQHSDYSAL